MSVVTFLPSNKTADVPPGSTLLDAARWAEVDLEAPCGGKGTCGKCVVQVISGDIETNSLGALTRTAVSAGNVLACKTKVLQTPVTVAIPEPLGRKDGKFSQASDDAMLIRRELLPKDWQYEPLAIKWLIEVPAPRPGDGLSDLDRLTRAIRKQWGGKEIIFPLSVIRCIPAAVRQNNGLVTTTIIHAEDRYHLVRIEPGDQTTSHYGLAIDLGTTTVAVQLVSLLLAEPLETRIDYNDQIPCGLDVISRINYAQRPGGLEELRRRILMTINRLLREAAAHHGVDPRLISNAVISGNTTMTHLLLGIDPENIRLAPYTPAVLEAPYLTAAEVGIEINPESWICISPSVGSYVGGDITAGLLCTNIAADSDVVELFIDIGTNGELVLGNNEFLLTCACSAGPAFEGAGIECGMRAALGAIERVEVNPETGAAEFSTIGDTKPKGICGSGMISLLADLLLKGWMDSAGKLSRVRQSPAIEVEGRHARYVIARAEESGTGKAITISELDIDNIIRAKAAIYSACALMLAQAGLTFEDIGKVYIAGGFGRFLDLDKARVIGLIPDLAPEKFQYIGNSSLMGSYMALVSEDFKQRQHKLARRMTYVDLSTDPSYMDQYTGALFLPHTDMDQFPAVREALLRNAR